MMEGDCEVLDWLRYYLSLNSLPLHYHYGGCRLWRQVAARLRMGCLKIQTALINRISTD